jgi:hypothetical protein
LTQLVPHPPQLAEFALVLTQEPEQLVKPLLHSQVHAPASPHSQCALTGSVPLQLEQFPEQHRPAPAWHDVPSVALIAPVHVWVPVEQDDVPAWHSLPPGLQEAPAVHATHWPLSQTLFIPHEEPFDAGFPVSVQVAPPSAQTVVPLLHGLLGGVQGAPFVHGWHAPLSQYRLVPQFCPFCAGPLEEHVGTPVAHLMVIDSQDPASLQSVPAAQAMHVPPLHTKPASHAVPFVTLLPVAMHVVFPDVSHVVKPS